MTPLAQELLEDLYSRRGITFRVRPWDDRRTCRFLDRLLREAKFVEMSAGWPLVGQLAGSMHEAFEDYDRVGQRRAYLPGPLTGIEFEQPSLRGVVEDRTSVINRYWKFDDKDLARISYWYRTAFVFVGQGENSTHVADRYQIQYETPRIEPGPRIWRIQQLAEPLPLVNSGLKPRRAFVHHNSDGQERAFATPVASIYDFVHLAMLALINSPRVIGRRGHYPHGRAEREALKKLGLVGKFPLRAWTEILLRVTINPEDRSGEKPKEMHLTGDRCLHYCRTFVRVRLGALEYVEGHWRGNPALGMKQSRYRVA
jgi:hypothetical protein